MINAFLKSAKVWWIGGIIYTLIMVGYYAHIGSSEVFRVMINGFVSVLGLTITTDMDKGI